MPEIEPVSINFQNAGYDSPLLLINCLSNIIKYSLQLSLLLLLPVSKLNLIKRIRPRLAQQFFDYLFWNGSLRIFIESFADMLLFSLLNLYEVNSLREINIFTVVEVSEILAVVFLLLATFVIFSVVAYYCANKKKLSDDAFLSKVGTFTEGAKRKDTITALIIPVMYFLRSLVLCLGLVLC